MFGVLIGTALIFAVLIRTVLICKFEDVGDVSRNLPLVDMYVTERVRVCCTFPSDVSFRISSQFPGTYQRPSRTWCWNGE